MPFKIGIDLDNTIISYGKLFHALAVEKGWVDPECPVTKESVKEVLMQRNGDDWEDRWRELQALAYGERIGGAEVFEGFPDFVREARGRGHSLCIVSHKTEYSNFMPSVNLRQSAMDLLDQNGFFRPENQDGLGFSPADIVFESSLDEKVIQIGEISLTHFVDDLGKVLDHPEFPRCTQRILFGGGPLKENPGLEWFQTWDDIREYFHLCGFLEESFKSPLQELALLPSSGNNRIRKARFASGESCVVKEFFRDHSGYEDRLNAEFDHLQALWDVGIRGVPKPMYKTKNRGVYSYVEGGPVERVGPGEIDQLADWIGGLVRKNEDLQEFSIRPGTDSRFCLGDYLDILERRWGKILSGCEQQEWGRDVVQFLQKDLLPLKEVIAQRFEEKLKNSGLSLDRPLESKERMFSPSDFGFHNILVDGEGHLNFLDFEYSGWDDPAKLLADFFHHVGQDVAWSLKWDLLDRVAEMRREVDPGFMVRWNMVADLIGLEWVLIILNVCAEGEFQRKQFARPHLDAAGLVRKRLEKARQLAEGMKERLENGGSFITLPERKGAAKDVSRVWTKV